MPATYQIYCISAPSGMSMVETDEYGINELGHVLSGCATTTIPIVSKSDMLRSIRQHNHCLKEMSEGCDALVMNIDDLIAQQAQVVTSSEGTVEERSVGRPVFWRTRGTSRAA